MQKLIHSAFLFMLILVGIFCNLGGSFEKKPLQISPQFDTLA
jgi:hypothetical protein